MFIKIIKKYLQILLLIINCLIQKFDTTEEPKISWPDPTESQLNSPLFDAIWKCIKKWNISVPNAYVGYCDATENHVVAIMNALQEQGIITTKSDLVQELVHLINNRNVEDSNTY